MADKDRAKNQSDAKKNVLNQGVAELEHSKARKNISDGWYRAIIQSAMEGFFLVNCEGDILDVNDAFCRMLGYSRDELLSMRVQDIEVMYINTPEKWAQVMLKCKKDGGSITEGNQRRKDGQIIDILISAKYLDTGSGLFFCFQKDITQQKKVCQQLKESEERYRTVFENTGTATAIIEEDTMLSLVNTEFERLSGYSKEEVEGKKSWTEFVVKEDLDRLREYHRLREIDPDAAPRQYVARFNDRQGKVKDILVTVDMIPRTKKRVISLLDVTESKRSAEALKASEEKLRLMFESVAEGITVADLEGNILQVNDATARLHGYKRKDELIGKSAFELIAEKDKPRAIVNLKRTLKEGYSGTIEYTLMRKDGDEFAAELNAATLRDASGKPIGFIAITRNITERKKMEESLRMERDKAQRYLDIAGVMIIAVDVDQKISLINQRGCQILGYRDEEIVGQNWLDSFVPERYRGEVKAVFKRLMAGEAEAVEYFENPVVTKRGEERIIAWHNSVVTDRAGNIVGALGSGEDITELKRVETELRSSHEQLRHFSAHLRRAREEERKQIALRIHDELGQTLTALKIDLSWLARRIPKEQELLVDKANSIIKMVDMTIQTVKGVSAELRPGILDDLGLTAAIEWQAQEFQKATGISCRVIPNHKEISLNQDAAIAFFRILQELLTNVFRHAQATSVNVSLKEKDGTAVLQVKDNGKGITRQQIAAPNSFGLLGVQERAHFLGGEVKIIGAPDKGTTITVSIPLHKEEKSGA